MPCLWGGVENVKPFLIEEGPQMATDSEPSTEQHVVNFEVLAILTVRPLRTLPRTWMIKFRHGKDNDLRTSANGQCFSIAGAGNVPKPLPGVPV